MAASNIRAPSRILSTFCDREVERAGGIISKRVIAPTTSPLVEMFKPRPVVLRQQRFSAGWSATRGGVRPNKRAVVRSEPSRTPTDWV